MEAKDVPGLLQAAEALMRMGDVAGVLAAYDAALALAPTDKGALLGKGKVLLQLNRPEEASRYLDYASRHHSDDRSIWQLLGTAALASGQGELAVKAFSDYQRLAGASVDNYLRLGVASYLKLDIERARNFVDLALLENPQSQEAGQWQEKLAGIKDKQSLLVDVGRTHCREGRLKQGIELFKQALALRESADAHLYLGRSLFVLQQYQEAIPSLQAALEAEPGNQELIAELASSLFSADQKEEADRLYERLLGMNADNVEALLGKVRLLIGKSQPEAARNYIERALKLAPLSPEAWLLKAQLLQKQGDLFEARLCADHAIAIDVRSAVGWAIGAIMMRAHGEKALADLYLGAVGRLDPSQRIVEATRSSVRLKDLAAEMSELDAFVARRPEYVNAYLDRASIYGALDLLERALAYLDTMRRKWPAQENEQLVCQEAVLLLNLRRPQQARAYFKRALELNPDSPVARQGLALADRTESENRRQHLQLVDAGRAQCSEGRLKQGIELLARALRFGESFNAHLYLGRALLDLKRYVEAVPHLHAAAQAQPENQELLGDLAMALLFADRKQQADQLYDRILHFNPSSLDALLGKGRLLLGAGRLESAEEYIGRALRIAPDSPAPWLFQAQLLQRNGDLKKARMFGDHAIALSIRWIPAWVTGKQILESAGEIALAERYASIVERLSQSSGTGKAPAPLRSLKEVSSEAKELDSYVLEHPEYIYAYSDRAAVYQALGELDRSRYYARAYTEVTGHKVSPPAAGARQATIERPPAVITRAPKIGAKTDEIPEKLKKLRHEIDVCRSELGKLSVRYKVGELSLEKYKSSDRELRAKIDQLESEATELTRQA